MHKAFKRALHLFSMVEEKKEHVSHKKIELTEKIRNNPWMAATFVSGILILVLLFATFSGAITGKAISAKSAGEKLLSLYESMGIAGLLVESVKEVSGMYQVNFNYQGQTVPIYVTKDGELFTDSLTPIKASDSGTDSQQTQQDIPKSEKPVVELFVMSYCPYGTQAEKGILPAVKLFGDKIDFNLRFVYYVMHPSQGEAEENLRQYCVQKEQEDKFNDYLECFLEEGNSDSCLTEAGVDKAKLNSCYSASDKEFGVLASKNDKSTWLSGQFPLFNADKELNEKYSVGGSPTLIINGKEVSAGRSPSAMLSAICSSFTEGNVPEECATTLPSEEYVPGFGWTLSSGTTTAGAQCY